MDILQVKSQIGVASLELNTALDKDGQATEWMRHWDNDNRVSVSIHKDLVAKLKAQGTKIKSLGLQTEKREGEQGAYTSHRIVEYKASEISL